jgi:hypothetical protein
MITHFTEPQRATIRSVLRCSLTEQARVYSFRRVENCGARRGMVLALFFTMRFKGLGMLLLGWTVVQAQAGTASAAITVPGDYPTIQAAMTAVATGAQPNGSVIEVQPGVYHEALLVDTTGRSMTVRGVAGSSATIVDAASSNRSALRLIRASGALRFEGLTFRGGIGVPGNGGGFTFEDTSPVLIDVVFHGNTAFDAGGGVMSRSNPKFSNCTIRNNSAQRFGGGMVIAVGSRPEFTNCQIRDNVSGTGGAGVGSIGSGGGLHINDASPAFRGCVIAGNRSKFAGGGIFHMGLYDSAYGTAMLVLEDTEISNNISERFASTDNPAEGGGVHIEDNAIGYLLRVKIVGNTANTSGGLSAYRARFEITSSIIETNHAQDPLSVGGFGGGIGISSNNVSTPLRAGGSLLLTDSVVRNNDARAGAGIFASGDQTCGSPTPSCSPSTALRASVQINQSLIADNVAGPLSGGGMRIERTNFTMTGSHVLRNSVGASAWGSYGGGMLFALGSVATISGTTIARNASVDFGGGIFVDGSAVLNVSTSIIYANSANSGGGMYIGNNGPPSGTIQTSVLADNFNYQIHEQACPPLQPTILEYSNNNIVARSGFSDLYYSTCGGATTSISTFNGFPRTSGNTSTAPSFVSFLATPDTAPAMLSWSVSRASSVTIVGVASSPDHTGLTGVAPASPTTYTLTNTGGPSSTATAFVGAARSWGGASDTPVTGDFDGDGKNDTAVYRGATGEWFLLQSAAGFRQVSWGAPSLGDIPVPADYDGDATTDIAVYRQATGQWFIIRSLDGGFVNVQWGNASVGDVPVARDYDGDSKADVAVYRTTTGQWFVIGSSAGYFAVSWGAPSLGDVPVAADYDGDGSADIAVYRTSTGEWFISPTSGGAFFATWGAPSFGDTPVPADYDGDGKADIAVTRAVNGDWFVNASAGGFIVLRWGFGDARVPGDYDGDNTAEVAIWRAATGSWLIQP